MTTTTIDHGTEQVLTISADRLAAHPDNVRSNLGDLADLTRSIKTQGVLIPLLVLPANDDGIHIIVAGHRRYHAGLGAGIDAFPVIARDLTAVQVLDAMLIENSQRADLAVADSICAVARYQTLEPTDTPTKIARRIGRTPTWVKSRLALATLPHDVLAMLDTGTLTIERAAALAAVVDLGDDAVRDCAEHVTTRGRWGDDPADTVARWRQDHDAAEKMADLIARLDAIGVTRFDSDREARAAKAVTLDAHGLGLIKEQARAHRHEPCHAVVVTRRWNGQVEAVNYCTTPKRHRTSPTRPADSEIAIEQPGPRSQAATDEGDKARRQARRNRHVAATALLAKARVPKADGLDLAARVWADTIGQHAATKAIEFLAIDSTDDTGTTSRRNALIDWLDNGGDPTRLLTALAAAELETWGRQVDPLPDGSKAEASHRWLDLLTRHGGYTTEGHDLPDS